MAYEIILSQVLGINSRQVATTIGLLDEGATVRCIARYRKEMTGSLDEVQVMTIRDRVQQVRDLGKGREAVVKASTEQGELTPELAQHLQEAEKMAILEDISLPFKPKHKTRASMDREKGLQPLADKLLSQEKMEVQDEAQAFIDEAKGVKSVEEALAGARDIIAEQIAED